MNMRESIDLSLNRSLGELVSSYWEFFDSDESKTEEEQSEFFALQDYLEGMGFSAEKEKAIKRVFGTSRLS